MPYDFSIQYKPGQQLTHVDMLSRFSENIESETIFETQSYDIPFTNHSITEEIRKHSAGNSFYNHLKTRISNGKWSRLNSIDRKFFRYRFHLTTEEDLIYYRTKLYIPPQYRDAVLSEAHSTHQGRLAMQNSIVAEFWWPQMMQDIIRFLRNCDECIKKHPIKRSELSSWPESQKWERLHIDWALTSQFGPVLIIVDACTNFIDAIPCTSRTTENVKKCLCRLFSFFSVPLSVVSDNAPEFLALKDWLAKLGIRLVNTPPYNPSSNGQAERAVKTIKYALRSYEPKIGDKYLFLQKVLLNHRASSSDVSPAERLFGFKPRTTVNKNFIPGQDMIYKNKMLKSTSPIKYVVQAGNNTAWIRDEAKTWLASLAQLEPVGQPNDTHLQTYKGWRSQRKKRANVTKLKKH